MALLVSRCPCAVVSQQRVYLRRGVVGQQGCCYSGVSARRGVAVCRDAQRVVAVGQRSRERSPQMQVANDVTSANELPSREARPGRRVNNSACRKAAGRQAPRGLRRGRSGAWSCWPRARCSWRMRPAASRWPWPPGAPRRRPRWRDPAGHLLSWCLPPAACPTRPPWRAGRPARLPRRAASKRAVAILESTSEEVSTADCRA